MKVEGTATTLPLASPAPQSPVLNKEKEPNADIEDPSIELHQRKKSIENNSSHQLYFNAQPGIKSTKDMFKDFNKKRSQALNQPHSHPSAINERPIGQLTAVQSLNGAKEFHK